MPELFGRVNRATVRVLESCGSQCLSDPNHACCGALHAHNGDLEGARQLARKTIKAFEPHLDQDGQPTQIVVNSAGCGSHMKEYGRLLDADSAWRDRALRFARRVIDFTEYVHRSENRSRLAEGLTVLQSGTVAYDDPCHLCHGQSIRSEPRELLEETPGLKVVDLSHPELCCGSAGIHSILHPLESQQQLAEKLDDLAASGADTLVTANPGCQMQWQAGVAQQGLKVEVLHIAEVLERGLASE